MKITLDHIGKRFNNDWIFRNLNYTFSVPNNYVILGANGSGKSTMLQLLAGKIQASEGSVKYEINNKIIHDDRVYNFLSYAAPYQELIEEFTLMEMLNLHFKFKKILHSLDLQKIIEILKLGKFRNKPLKYFSSGMKQRVKLILALLSDTQLVMLDEPLSNLDKAGYQWYHDLITKYSNDRMIVVCSNKQEDEYFFCKNVLQVEDYK